MASFTFVPLSSQHIVGTNEDDQVFTSPFNANTPIWIDGFDGIDIAYFTKPSSHYSIITSSAGATVVTAQFSLGAGSADAPPEVQYVDVTLTNFELLRFDNGNGTYENRLLGDTGVGVFNGGTTADDKLVNTSKNDVFDGQGGIDSVKYAGKRAEYSVKQSSSGFVVSSTSNETDTLRNVERLNFSDLSVALDVSGNAGQAYRLYQAAFNRAPDKPGLGYQMNALDTGLTLTQVAQNFINSPEFSATYGNLNDVQFVNQLYANVLHRAAEPEGLNFHLKNLSNGVSRAATLVGFSESPENQAALIGVIKNGMDYIPVA